MIRVLHVGDVKAQKIASVLTSKTAKRILEHLEQHIATESDLVKELGISPSTVHYNIALLKECGLIVVEGVNYSVKGKEVLHYTLAQESIVIAPTADFDVMARLRSIIPIFILVVVLVLLQFFAPLLPFGSIQTPDSMDNFVHIDANARIVQSEVLDSSLIFESSAKMADSNAQMANFDNVTENDTNVLIFPDENAPMAALMVEGQIDDYADAQIQPLLETDAKRMDSAQMNATQRVSEFQIWPYLTLGSTLALLCMLFVFGFEYLLFIFKRKNAD
jgi:DNA-binding transcriptional ArsR family regulator